MANERWIPSLPEVSRETLTVLAGATAAAIIFAYVAPAWGRWVAARLPGIDDKRRLS